MKHISLLFLLIAGHIATAQTHLAPDINTNEIPVKPSGISEDDPEYGLWMYDMMCFAADMNASSTLSSSGKNSYSVEMMADDNPNTAWVEGKDDYGIGETITLKGVNSEMWIYNGYQKSESSFYSNSRVKAFIVYFDDKKVGQISLEDTPGGQHFNMSSWFETHGYPDKITLEISEVYKGKQWKDTAITEIFFVGG